MSSLHSTPSSKWTVLLIASLGSFLMTLDNSMLFMAVPQITTSLKEDPALVTWVPTASLVGVTAFSIPFGRLSDVWGRKRLFLLGLIAVAVSSLIGGFSHNAYQLIGMRFLQGASSSLVFSNAWALTSEAFSSQERGKALGFNTAVGFLGLATGPVIGGLLVTQFNTWRIIFFVLIPIYLVLSVLSSSLLSFPTKVSQKRSTDLFGSLSFILGLALLMLGISFGRLAGWDSLPSLAFFISSVAFLNLFGYIELYIAKDPMLDLRTFGRNSQFTLGNTATFLHYMSAHQGLTILISFYVQWTLHRSAAVAGVIMLAKFLTMSLFSPPSGWLSDKIGARWLCGLGMAFITTSLLLLADMDATTSLISIFLRLSILGVGVGLFASPNINSVLGSISQDRVGTASGALGTSRSLGGTLGLALVSSLMASGMAEADFAKRLSIAFIALAVVAFLGVVVSALRGKRPLAEPDN